MKKLLLALCVLVSATACNADTESQFIYVDKETGKEVVAKRVVKKEVKTYIKLPVYDTSKWSGNKYDLHRVCIDGKQYYSINSAYGDVLTPVLDNRRAGYRYLYIVPCDPNDFKAEKR